MASMSSGNPVDEITPRENAACPAQPSPKEKAQKSSIAKECASDQSSLPYSSFTRKQKWLIISLSTFAAAFSPLSSFIFFPAITALSDSLRVSVGRINLTITSYMVVAGIAPALLGDLADTTGRRVVYLLMMSIYCVANVGLALQSNWAALFVLRMVQSFGSAATIAVGYGVVSDIATPAERGEFVSGMVLGPNIATAIGPIAGGALAESPGWRWIFWLLSLLSGTCLLSLACFLPETARSVVGNGSAPVSGLRRALFSYLRLSRLPAPPEKSSNAENGQSPPGSVSARKNLHVPNPIASLKLLWAKDCILIVLIFGIFYMNLSCVQASTSTLFISLYGISDLKSGLVYLPSGIGSIIGAYGTGFVLKYDYRVTARKHGITINIEGGDDINMFPIEKARFRSIWYSISTAGICTIGYGWALNSRLHIAIPLVLQFIIGFSTAMVFNMSGTLLVDVHPKTPSAASAANSIVRCLLAGGGLALVQIFIENIGVQWTFTLFGGLCMGCLGLAQLEWSYGKLWRDKMRERGAGR